MKDFNSYQKPSKDSPMDILKGLASKYEGASESQLLDAIVKEAESRKKAGTLTDQDIDNFVKTISPMLNNSQKQKLKEVIKNIKS